MANFADMLFPLRREAAMRAAMAGEGPGGVPAPDAATVFGNPVPTHMGKLDPVMASQGVPPAEFWAAWNPGQPYTGSPEQQAKMAQLLAMQDKNLQGVGAPPQMAANPAPQAQPQVPPQAQVQAAPQAPQQVQAEAAAPADPQSKWQTILENIKKPEVFGPLQTFFSAISAPLAPWETTGSRLGRASMMMQMHQGMISANAADLPREERMKDLAMQKLEGEVEGQGTQNRRNAADATVAEATVGDRIEQAKVALANAKRQGNKEEILLKKAELEQAIAEKYGERTAEQGLRKGEADIQKTLRDANEPYWQRGSATKGVDKMSVSELSALINSYASSFRETGAAREPGASEIAWIAETYGEQAARDFEYARAKLNAAGIETPFKTRDGKTLPSDGKKSYTLGADGKLK